MGGLAGLWRLGASGWRMPAVLMLGVLAASTLLAAAPIYARAMADLGLKFTVREELRAAPVVRVGVGAAQLGTPDAAALREAVAARIDERLGWFARERSLALESARLTIGRTGAERREGSPLGRLFAIEGVERRVRVVEGRAPSPDWPDGRLEVAMGARAAAVARLAPGDEFLLIEEIDTCDRIIPQGLQAQPPCDATALALARHAIPARLTGLFAAEDADDPFWGGASARYLSPAPPLADSGLVVPLLAHPEAVLGGLAARWPGQRLEPRWSVFADVDRLDQGNYERARDDILALNRELRALDGYAVSPLTVTLDAFGRSAGFQRAPLVILLAQIAAIALFYVAIVSAAAVERRAEEIALLRGRGASVAQVTALHALEGLALAAPAVLAAPFLAGGVTALLGLTPLFRDVSGGQPLPVAFEPLAFPLAALGAVLAALALAVPAWLAARREPAGGGGRRAARPAPGLFQRYYLDAALGGLALLALWELNERDSVFTPSATGGVSSDPLLLATPAIVIAAAAALLARVLPLAPRLAARAMGRLAGAPLALGLWQLARRPGPSTQLGLLLMMTVATGVFAASYAATAERSYADRARFAAGVELRAGDAGGAFDLPTDPAELEARAGELAGVTGAAAVLRLAGETATPAGRGPAVSVLAVPPGADALLWWRDDFADEPLDALLARLDTGETLPGLPLPDGSRELSVWANPTRERATMTLWARLRDASGRHELVDFGKLDFSGWRELRAVVESRGFHALEEPLTLVGLILTEPPNQFNADDAPLFLDDLAALDGDGARTPLEAFEGVARWRALPGAEPFPDELRLDAEAARSGERGARLSFRRGTTGERRGLFPAGREALLPALASDAFLEANGLEVGDEARVELDGIVVAAVVRARYERFPTLPALEGPSLLLDRDQLLRWAAFAESAPGDLARANELWLDAAPDAPREPLLAALDGWGLRRVTDRAAALAAAEANPLVAASGAGVLAVSFAAALALVAAALLVSLWTVVRRRRVEFAVLAAIGLTRGQALGALALEYAAVGVAGAGAGAVAGLVVGRRMMAFLDVTERGLPVEPGFALQTDWGFVAVGAGAVAAVLALALAAASRALTRGSEAAALRME